MGNILIGRDTLFTDVFIGLGNSGLIAGLLAHNCRLNFLIGENKNRLWQWKKDLTKNG